MGKKLDRVYHALLDGAYKGHSGEELYRYVIDICPKASSKRIVRASLLALTDSEVKDRNVLNVIYAVAIKYRLVSLGVEEDQQEDDDEALDTPSVTKKMKTKLESSAAEIPVLKD